MSKLSSIKNTMTNSATWRDIGIAATTDRVGKTIARSSSVNSKLSSAGTALAPAASIGKVGLAVVGANPLASAGIGTAIVAAGVGAYKYKKYANDRKVIKRAIRLGASEKDVDKVAKTLSKGGDDRRKLIKEIKREDKIDKLGTSLRYHKAKGKYTNRLMKKYHDRRVKRLTRKLNKLNK